MGFWHILGRIVMLNIEAKQKEHRSKERHSKVKEVTNRGKRRAGNACITNKKGKCYLRKPFKNDGVSMLANTLMIRKEICQSLTS